MSKTAIVITVIIIAGLIGITYVMTRDTDTTTTTTTNTTNTTNNPPVVTNPPATTAGAPIVSVDKDGVVSNSTVVLTGDINPNGAQTTYVYEYGKTNELGAKTSAQNIGSGHNMIPATGYIKGLSASTLYYFRLSATNSVGTTNSAIKSFTTHSTTLPPTNANAPTASTVAADNTTRTETDLNGSVNPKGSPTSYWFEYGTSNSLGLATSFKSVGSGETAQAVSVSIDGLKPSTQYFFRVNAQNNFGTVNGAIANFTTEGPAAATKPTVSIAQASPVSSKSATVHGSVTPNGADTVYWFEYSTDSLVGSVLGTATTEKSINSSSGRSDVSTSLTGLSANTKYNYRIAAKNVQGTVRSEVMSFTTAGN